MQPTRQRGEGPARWVVGGCMAVAGLDLLQVAVLPWVDKHAAALAGAALYTLLAVLVWRGSRRAALLVLLMPLVPILTLAAWGAGLPVPVTPDLPMMVVMGLQLAAAAAAARFTIGGG